MNNRFRELSDEAENGLLIIEMNAYSIAFDKWQEKFAELIIKECASVAMGYKNHHGKIFKNFGITW